MKQKLKKINGKDFFIYITKIVIQSVLIILLNNYFNILIIIQIF